MKILLLSDIHANRFGLEAVLEAAKGHYDQALCLGDVVGYGAHPNECCEILRDVKSWCLRGNHDAAAIDQLSIKDFNPIASEAMKWTRRQLNVINISWLESLRSKLDRPEENFQAVHGSVRDPLEEYIVDNSVARESFALMQRPICFFGHTHIAEFYSRVLPPATGTAISDNFRDGGKLGIKPERQYLINPGSCGQPRDGNPQARYAFFDTTLHSLEVFAIDYPIQEARKAILDSGLPPQLGNRLLVGE